MKQLTFILIILSFTSVSYGQFLQWIGVKAGVGISNNQCTNIPADYNLRSKSGYSIRLFAEFFDNDIVNLQLETALSQKGSKYTIPAAYPALPTAKKGEMIYRNDYLSTALLLKINHPTGFGITLPYLMCGMQYHTSIKQNFRLFDENIKKNAWGISLGFGVEVYEISPFALLFEYRFENDLTNSYDSNSSIFKNHSHTVMAGIKF